jgi:hypothetical protein
MATVTTPDVLPPMSSRANPEHSEGEVEEPALSAAEGTRANTLLACPERSRRVRAKPSKARPVFSF